MAEARDDRINQALEGLVESLLPQDETEDDAVADERYWRAVESAQDTLDSAQDPSIAEDEGHVADLIRQRCEACGPQLGRWEQGLTAGSHTKQ